jgi:hypothetical protein
MYTEMNQQKIALAVVVTGVMVAVSLAPILLDQAFAKRTTTTTCDIGGNSRSGSCPGNSGSNDNDNQCQSSVTKAGEGKGKGEIKDSSESC